MSVAVVTGSTGLIGAEAVRLFASRGLDIVGIDSDMRAQFFGPSASTRWKREQLIPTALKIDLHAPNRAFRLI